MPSETISAMFSEQIEDVFGNFINDGRIQCTEEQFREKLVLLQKQIKGVDKKKANRKASNFMNWLSSEKRNEIKDEFFDDFEDYEDWSVEGIRSYYEKKSLPVDKLNLLIEKKSDQGKEIKKPRLMSLITIKAGLIWKDMTDEEKEAFKTSAKSSSTPNVETTTSTSSVSNKGTGSTKKGRPAGYKATQYASEEAIASSIKNAQEKGELNTSDDGESVELEMFTHDGKELFKDDEDNVYNDDCEVIGRLTSDGNVEFN